jgi:glycosyltransferase involved in cell wall biosynthesis
MKNDNKDSKFISIIVPCYNYGHFLHETLNSVQKQTYQNWECIIVDDGSTDNTKKVAEEYCKKDSRFNYLYKTNGGLSSARNTGLKASKGEYIQLLDADDLIEDKKLEIHSEYLSAHPETDIVYGSMMRFLHNNRAVTFYTNPDNDYNWMPEISGKGRTVLNTLLFDNIMVVSSPLLRKSVIEKTGYFNEQLFSAEDWEYWLRCCLQNIHFQFLKHDNTLTLIRTHEHSMMTNYITMVENQMRTRKILSSMLSDEYRTQRLVNELLRDEQAGSKAIYFAKQKKILPAFIALLEIKSISKMFEYFFHSIYWFLKAFKK